MSVLRMSLPQCQDSYESLKAEDAKLLQRVFNPVMADRPMSWLPCARPRFLPSFPVQDCRGGLLHPSCASAADEVCRLQHGKLCTSGQASGLSLSTCRNDMKRHERASEGSLSLSLVSGST